jgi:hypothetical protein
VLQAGHRCCSHRCTAGCTAQASVVKTLQCPLAPLPSSDRGWVGAQHAMRSNTGSSVRTGTRSRLVMVMLRYSVSTASLSRTTTSQFSDFAWPHSCFLLVKLSRGPCDVVLGLLSNTRRHLMLINHTCPYSASIDAAEQGYLKTQVYSDYNVRLSNRIRSYHTKARIRFLG